MKEALIALLGLLVLYGIVTMTVLLADNPQDNPPVITPQRVEGQVYYHRIIENGEDKSVLHIYDGNDWIPVGVYGTFVEVEEWLGWPVFAGEYSGIDPGFYSNGPPPDQFVKYNVEIGLATNGNVVWRKIDPNHIKETEQ